MPTWRGQIRNKEDEEQHESIMEMLEKLEKKVDNNTIIFVKRSNYGKNK